MKVKQEGVGFVTALLGQLVKKEKKKIIQEATDTLCSAANVFYNVRVKTTVKHISFIISSRV